MKRRQFIQSAALATAGMASLPSFLQAAKKGKAEVGLQLYTLRDVITSDPKGVLKKVAEAGYKKLETYGHKDGKLFGMSNAEFKAFVKDLGMQTVSGHFGMDLVRGNWEGALADAKSLGQEFIVVPSLGKADRTEDGIKKVCDELNKAAVTAKKYGLKLGYHNHAFEFEKVGDKVLYDIMLERLDPSLVSMELDIFWIINAGFDPVKYFEKYPGRFAQWHIKDMDKEDRSQNADIGKGSIDYKSLFAKAKLAGMKHFYVEQETYKTSPPIECIKVGADYLKTIL